MLSDWFWLSQFSHFSRCYLLTFVRFQFTGEMVVISDFFSFVKVVFTAMANKKIMNKKLRHTRRKSMATTG